MDELKNEMMQGLCEALSIKLVHGAPYHPQSQGAVERGNKILQDKLLQWCASNPDLPWSAGLGKVQLIINSTPTEATRRTPHELVYGHCQRSWNVTELSYEKDENKTKRCRLGVLARDICRWEYEDLRSAQERSDANTSASCTAYAPLAPASATAAAASVAAVSAMELEEIDAHIEAVKAVRQIAGANVVKATAKTLRQNKKRPRRLAVSTYA